MGFIIVIPMNLYFSDFYYYHKGIFFLQAAGAAGVFLQNYGFTLNIKLKKDLFQMKINCILIFFMVLWTRIIRYFIIGYHIICLLNEKETNNMIVVAWISMVSMGLLNVMWLGDSTFRLIKFLPMSVDENVANDEKSKIIREEENLANLKKTE